jgi:predicted CXXCH cytochrome family protein
LRTRDSSHSIGKGMRLTFVCSVLAYFATLAAGGMTFQDDPPNLKLASCIDSGCHSSILKHKVVHTPVAKDNCLACHENTNEVLHLFKLQKPGNELCLDCHDPTHGDRIVHKPVADGQCLSCHDAHGSDHAMTLLKDPAQDLCLDCHKEDYSKFDFVHGPVAVGACVVCHESHSSSFKGLLTNRPSKLCLECHEEAAPTGLGLRRQHKPFEEGCVSCHNPHASNAKFQLNAAVPDLCLGCHEGMEKTLETATSVHGPTQTIGGCTECHNPHYSQLPKLQKQTQPSLCLKCHDKPVEATDGHMLPDMAKLLKDNPNHHGPIRDGSCTLCHQPHAAEQAKLLFQAYPPEFYAPFKVERYALCFTCHQADMVEDESGTGLTGFRQGDKNLHWLHVNKEKGRTCRACHEVHASKQEFHIREAVPFGPKNWMLRINFAPAPDGGSCAPACHKPKSYSRTPVFEPTDQSP